MKIAIISDTHFGAREGRGVFHDYFQKFYDTTFFPECERRGIKTVLHLGDLFDRRKYIDYFSLKRCREYFFDPLDESDMRMFILVGNHDIALRNSLNVNSPSLLLQDYDRITTIVEPGVYNVGAEMEMLLVPWICPENREASLRVMETGRTDICFGHFEISGFSMYRGMESHDGLDRKLFKRFDIVCSGHFHHRSYDDGILYVGSPYEITHNDYNDPRGFHIFDTETREIEFIHNPHKLFERYVYDDTMSDPSKVDVSYFKDKFIKIVVQKKTDYYKFDTFLDKVYNCGAHDIKVMEDISELSPEELDETIDIEDTVSILTHYVKAADVTVDRDELAKYMKQLYVEAVNVAV